MIYLSGAAPTVDRLPTYQRLGIGVMMSPDIHNKIIPEWPCWAADNGCFNHGDSFDSDRWFSWLTDRPHQGNCLFAVAPDVVGDWEATNIRSAAWLPAIQELGYPAAYVGQDGLVIDNCPWETFDWLFIGGSTEWKMGLGAKKLITHAIENGVPVHVGRVNSASRYKYFADMGCKSADGTFLAFGPDKNLIRLEGWLTDRIGREQDAEHERQTQEHRDVLAWQQKMKDLRR